MPCSNVSIVNIEQVISGWEDNGKPSKIVGRGILADMSKVLLVIMLVHGRSYHIMLSTTSSIESLPFQKLQSRLYLIHVG